MMPSNGRKGAPKFAQSVPKGTEGATCSSAANPCRQAFLDTTQGKPHASFDPLTTLAAVRGPEAVGTAFCTDCDGSNVIDAKTGDNTWKAGTASNQSYLVLRNATAASAALDELLCQPPAHPPAPTPAPPTPAPPPMLLATVTPTLRPEPLSRTTSRVPKSVSE